MAYLAVNKNTGAKFYLGKQGGNLYNPDQGTYIDSIITDGDDFYLISQRTLQGTATPSHYMVLHSDFTDRKKIEPDDFRNMLAVLSHKLCYMYYNVVGSIKIPVISLSNTRHQSITLTE